MLKKIFLTLVMVVCFASLAQALGYTMAESTTAMTTTGTSTVTYLNVNFTAEAGTPYLILYYGEGRINSTAGDMREYFRENSTGTMTNVMLALERGGAVNHDMSFFYPYVINVTSTRLVQADIRFDASAANILSNQTKGRIVVLKLNDTSVYWSYTAAEQANLGNSFVTNTITIPAADAGTYLIISAYKAESDSTSSSIYGGIDRNSNVEIVPYLIGGEGTFSYARMEDRNTASEPSWEFGFIRTLTGQNNYSIAVGDIDATASADIAMRSLVAVKLDSYTYRNITAITQQSTTSTTPVITANLSFTNYTGTYLILSAGAHRFDSATTDRNTDLNVANNIEAYRIFRPKDALDIIPNVMMDVYNTSTGSVQALQRHYRTGGSGTAYAKNVEVIALYLDPITPPGEPPADTCTYSGTGTWAITDNCVITTSVNLNNNLMTFGCTSSVQVSTGGRIYNGTIKSGSSTCKLWVNGGRIG